MSFRMPLAVLLLAAAPVGAQVRVPEAPPIAPPPVARLQPDTWPRAEVRPLSIAAAEELLKSAEGPHWYILHIQAPAPSSAKKAKSCKPIPDECVQATQFAHKFRAEITCSALYEQTTVVLTTVSVPKKAVTTTAASSPTKRLKHAGATRSSSKKGSAKKGCQG